jgi:hypothetical protein
MKHADSVVSALENLTVMKEQGRDGKTVLARML